MIPPNHIIKRGYQPEAFKRSAMNPDLTPKQTEFLQYLEQQITQTGKAPSLRQAAEDTGVSHAAVAQLIRALEDKGGDQAGGPVQPDHSPAQCRRGNHRAQPLAGSADYRNHCRRLAALCPAGMGRGGGGGTPRCTRASTCLP